MAAKAHEISLEAGSKMAAAMKDVVNAAAGLSGFVIESARDLVQYMVRRGQMTQEEADKLIRQVEEHQPKRKAPPPAPAPSAHKPVAHAAPKPAPKPAAKPAAKAAKAPAKAAKPAPKKAAKPAAKKAAKPAAKKPAAKSARHRK
jgi:outer membrane biosynthesis protein TonB